ncbi:MAG: polysaccharide deacetylase family protein [Candidatus Hydrogenedentes bacterium]|nr:polysaccharide deacetylase family protein [Candidatus Hydrogenedentota bacterium]
MKKWMTVFSLCVLCCVLAQGQEETYAEKLGWPKGSRVLMIHADDGGMSHSSNAGIIGTIEAGTVTSVSIMMPCPWVPEFVAYVKAHPEVDAGVHLTYTAEWDFYRWPPVAGRDAVPGLVDAMGYMHDNVGEVVKNATPDEVEKELRAQIALAEKMGIEVTHIDSHMGTLFAKPEYFERFVKVGIEKQLPLLVAGGHGTVVKKEDASAYEQLKPYVEKIWAAGLPVFDDIDTSSYSWRSRDKKAEYIAMIKALKPGVTWFNCHPTNPTEESEVITNNRELLFGDYLTLIDPEIKKVIEEEGIILTTFRELKQRRDAVGK